MMYKVLKGVVVFGEKTYLPGDTFEDIGDRSWSRLVKKGMIENVVVPSEPIKEPDSTGIQGKTVERPTIKATKKQS